MSTTDTDHLLRRVADGDDAARDDLLEAVTLARRAASRGLPDAARLLADPAFDSVRGCDEFRRLLDEVTPRKTP
jgi:hypothetical protein